MKIKTLFVRSLTVAAGLCAAANTVNASQATFTDSWKDTAVLISTNPSEYGVKTTGSFSVKISVPLPAGVISNFDAGTTVALTITPAGGTAVTIIAGALGDDPKFTAAKKSAAFPVGESTNRSVTVAWTATAITVTGSVAADVLGEELLATHGIVSRAEINLAVAGADATPLFTYDDNQVPVSGNNTETVHNNPGGTTTLLEAGSITGTADFVPPAVAITAPAPNAKTFAPNTTIELKGTASDKYSVTGIQYSLNGGDLVPIVDVSPALPANSVTWTIAVDLAVPGSNSVEVFVANGLEKSHSVSRTFLLIVTNSAAVTVSPAGAGTVKGLKTGQLLQEGNSYAVTATPVNRSFIFTQWTDGAGTFLSSDASFKYVDTDGTLIANFGPNPFYNTRLAGTYTALFFTSDSVAPSDAGYITLAVTGGGVYSGKLFLGASGTPFLLSGQLTVGADGFAAADSTVKVNKSEVLAVHLQVATNANLSADGAGLLTGFVNAISGDVTTPLPIQGKLSLNSPDIIPGHYNVVLSPTADPATGPGGWSYANVTVGNTGGIATVLNLADGTSPVVTFSSTLARDGTCPVYGSLYGGKGVILGWMQFANDGTGAVASAGNFNWVKLPVANKFYTNGFAVTPTASGRLYDSINIFDWTAGTLIVDQGLSDELDLPVTFNPAKNTFTAPSKVTLTLTPSSGALKGTFSLGNTAFSGRGVVKDDAGYGFYSIPAMQETGPIGLFAAPAPGGD